MGTKKFILKENESGMPAARAHLRMSVLSSVSLHFLHCCNVDSQSLIRLQIYLPVLPVDYIEDNFDIGYLANYTVTFSVFLPVIV